jgi:hypothetical protein
MTFAELRNRNNSPAQCEALLEPLLKADFVPARDFAIGLLTGRNLRSESRRGYAFAAATQLLAHFAAQCWPLIWKHILSDRPF